MEMRKAAPKRHGNAAVDTGLFSALTNQKSTPPAAFVRTDSSHHISAEKATDDGLLHFFGLASTIDKEPVLSICYCLFMFTGKMYPPVRYTGGYKGLFILLNLS